MKWIAENANWIFSGVGIIIFSALGYLVKRLLEHNSNGQNQKADRGSVAIQAGRDIKVDKSKGAP